MTPNVDSTETPLEALRRSLQPEIVTRGRVVVIGLGGIGLYLVRGVITFLTGLLQSLGPQANIEVLLCDGDDFQVENTYRMDVPEFGNKATVLMHDVLERCEVPGLIVRCYPQFVTADNVADLIHDGDCVLLACDNHKTRNIVGRSCAAGVSRAGTEARALQNVVLISGGNDGIENGNRGTYGNVQVHMRRNGTDVTAPLTAFHPEIAEPADKSPGDKDCLEAAATGAAQISIVNMAVASAMCNALLRLLMSGEDEPIYDELCLDAFDGAAAPQWYSRVERHCDDVWERSG
jgi:ThiF family